MPEVVHVSKSDSPGYTRYVLDEPIGTAGAGVLATGPMMKLSEERKILVDEDGSVERQTEKPFEILLHGQQVIDLPNEVKELTLSDGSTLKLSKPKS